MRFIKVIVTAFLFVGLAASPALANDDCGFGWDCKPAVDAH